MPLDKVLQYYRLEIIGRYPTDPEVEKFEIEEAAPIWMLTQQANHVFNAEISDRLRHTRD